MKTKSLIDRIIDRYENPKKTECAICKTEKPDREIRFIANRHFICEMCYNKHEIWRSKNREAHDINVLRAIHNEGLKNG